MKIHEIVTGTDPLYIAFLDLYQSAFPLNEQWPLSAHEEVLCAYARGEMPDGHLIAAIGEEGQLIGMARYDLYPTQQTAILWYFAVTPERRGGGIGSAFFNGLRERIAVFSPAIHLLLFEVEDPQTASAPEEADQCFRRIRFYRRLGARVLRGIEYMQVVEGYDPIPMYLMACAIDPASNSSLTPLQVFEIATTVLTSPPRCTGNLEME